MLAIDTGRMLRWGLGRSTRRHVRGKDRGLALSDATLDDLPASVMLSEWRPPDDGERRFRAQGHDVNGCRYRSLARHLYSYFDSWPTHRWERAAA